MKMMLVSAVVLVSCFVIGCAMPKPEEIIGEWIAAPDSPKEIQDGSLTVKIKDQPRLIFKEDGSCKFENMPEALLSGPFPDNTEIVSGTGTWTIGKYQGSKVVFLEIKQINGNKLTSASQVHISKWWGKITLYYWIGEEGGPRYEFIRSTQSYLYLFLFSPRRCFALVLLDERSEVMQESLLVPFRKALYLF